MASDTPFLRFWSPWLAGFAGLWLAAFFGLAADPLTAIVQHGPLTVVGFVGAVVGNATAVGGGIVFIPYLLLFTDLDPVDSLKLALATQAFGMSSGAIAWSKKRVIPLGVVLALVPAVMVGVVVSTLLITPTGSLVRSVFGPVSVAIGIWVLARLGRDPRGTRIRLGALLFSVTVVGTVITGWAAIGVGEVVAAWLMVRDGLAPERAIGLGVALLATSSVLLTLVHWLFLGGLPWLMASFVILGAVFGARLGPVVVQRMPPRVVKIGFAWVAIAHGLLFIWQSAR